jgi:hypothetical protein
MPAGRRSRLRAWLLACLAGLGVSAPASASSREPGRAAPPPAEWVRYARLLGDALRGWLDAPTPEGERLRAQLEGGVASAAPVSAPLKVWIGADGAVTRAESPSLASDAAKEDLRVLVVGRRLDEPPPTGLPLPIRLQLTFTPPPADNGAPAARPSP